MIINLLYGLIGLPEPIEVGVKIISGMVVEFLNR